MAGYGRPMKGKTRRIPITIHSSVGTLDAIDDYVEKKNENGGSYSRSDFFAEATDAYMKTLGISPK